MTTQSDFIQQYAADGELTAAQAFQLLELGEGDTGLPENSDVPEVTTDDADSTAEAAQASEGELTAENAVLMAKDGKHTIPYDRLTQARDGEKHWKNEAAAAQAEIATLKAEAQQRADAGIAPTQADKQVAAVEAAIDAGADPDIFGDFSEEALARGVATIVDKRVAAIVEAQLAKAMAPQQKIQQQTKMDAHLAAITEKHPDLDSMLESQELEQWVTAQPAYVRVGFQHVMQHGSTAELIEFFDTYKQATGRNQPEAEADAIATAKAAAKAAIAKAQPLAPNSLSDIPGGKAVAGSRDEAMANMDSLELADAMNNMSAAQIEAFLNRTG
jgi:hypothetical protein